MKTKVVYVLISNESDYYCEQLLMSLFSLKHYNPDSYTEIATDSDTYQTLVGNRSLVKDYSNKICIFDIPSELDKKQRSRYLKTSLRNLINGDYLFLDTDTIIVGRIDEIDYCQFDIGAVVDFFSLEGKDYFSRNVVHTLGYHYVDEVPYFNSGVLYVKDNCTTHNLYNWWHQLWKQSYINGIYQDQPSLYIANVELNQVIKQIDAKWNCMVSFYSSLDVLPRAVILHIFSSTYDKMGTEWNLTKLLYALKNDSSLIKSDLSCLQNIKQLFETNEYINQLKLSRKHRFLCQNPPDYINWKNFCPESGEYIFEVNWNCTFIYKILYYWASLGPVWPLKLYIWTASKKGFVRKKLS